MINRFSVPLLANCTVDLANVASNKKEPDLILTNTRILSTYTEQILTDKEIWISKGRIACIKPKDSYKVFSTLNKSDAKETTIGVVEVQLIMQQALAAQSIQTQVEEKRDLYESIVIKEENRLRELEKEILRQKSLLTPDSFV